VKSELALIALLLAACSGNDEAPPPKTQPPGVLLVPSDGGTGSTAVTVPPGVDPSSVHLDDYGGTVRPVSPQPLPGRDRRAIDVTLRSTPPGALVSVDGTPVGNTPAFWSGFADGREHQFVFTLPGHAIARYRFVPVSSGVIHARLDPIAVERDAGVAPPPEVVPQAPQPQQPITPPSPPPTVIAPAADAAVVAPPPTGSGSATGSAPPNTGGMGPQN
jgi:hypothetical protein